VQRMDRLVQELESRMETLDQAAGHGSESPAQHAAALAAHVVPAMAAVREVCDRIEDAVADEFWTLPKYTEMLFLV
jgi:glutamine synthetase